MRLASARPTSDANRRLRVTGAASAKSPRVTDAARGRPDSPLLARPIHNTARLANSPTGMSQAAKIGPSSANGSTPAASAAINSTMRTDCSSTWLMAGMTIAWRAMKRPRRTEPMATMKRAGVRATRSRARSGRW